VIQEVAQRLDLFDPRRALGYWVLSYYSMLRTKPAGKYNVQVCTNISCMLRGGYEILDHCKRRLGIENRQTPAERAVFAGRGGVHRRLLLRAGHAGELTTFHDELTPAKRGRDSRPVTPPGRFLTARKRTGR